MIQHLTKIGNFPHQHIHLSLIPASGESTCQNEFLKSPTAASLHCGSTVLTSAYHLSLTLRNTKTIFHLLIHMHFSSAAELDFKLWPLTTVATKLAEIGHAAACLNTLTLIFSSLTSKASNMLVKLTAGKLPSSTSDLSTNC